MSKYAIASPAMLFDPVTGAPVGVLGQDGKEYFWAASVAYGAVPTLYQPGSVAITGGTINGATIGQTTPAAVKTSNSQAAFGDSSGTPGNVTNNNPRGRVALAAGASTIVVTSTLVTASSLVMTQMRSTDGAATAVVSAIASAGSFTITFNGASTGTAAQVDFLVVN